jgi:hypothetical protein
MSNGKRTPIITLLALRQQNEISVCTCQRIVRKDLEDSVTAEITGTTFLMFSTIKSIMMDTIDSWVFSTRWGYSPYSMGISSLFAAIF